MLARHGTRQLGGGLLKVGVAVAVFGGHLQNRTLERIVEVGRMDVVAFQNLVAKVGRDHPRSEEHTSELQSLMRISYAVFCLKKKIIEITLQNNLKQNINNNHH